MAIQVVKNVHDVFTKSTPLNTNLSQLDLIHAFTAFS